MGGSREEGSSGLLGRQDECDVLDALVADAAAGTSRVLVLRGEAGAGKSALVAHVSAGVRGWRVLSAVGVESEMELAYSGLHQLCTPLTGLLDRLPSPQRQALSTVFGLSAGPAPDPFLVALAALSLLAEAAENEPVLCTVDDAQWLDQASIQVLTFVARRLLAERVALVCVARAGIGDQVLPAMPTLSVGGLGHDDGRRLLLSNLHGPLDEVVCEQLVAESHGNPLALIELPREWTAAQLAGGFGLPDAQHVASRIEQSYARRIEQLPPPTRLLLVTAAADPVGDLTVLHRALGVLDVDFAAAAPAVDDRLLDLRRRVEFAHPLVRSAAYRTAPVDDRRRAHHALALATDVTQDPDRHAWHRARAAAGPDEDVATEMERSAVRAQARGGLAAAAAFRTRAAELTPDPAHRVARALDAAAANLQAGTFDSAVAMLAMADAGPVEDPQRAFMDLLRAQLAFGSSRGRDAAPLLLSAAGRLEPLDPGLARDTYLDAFGAALFAARLEGSVGVPQVAKAARSAPRRPGGERTPADALLDALVAMTDGYDVGVPACREAVALLGRVAVPEDRLRWLWQGGVLALETWDDAGAYALTTRHVDAARRSGALSELSLALSSRIPVLVLCGELPTAAALVSESASVEEATGISAAPYGALIVAAWQGRERATQEMVAATLAGATARGEGVGVAICEYSRAVLGNATGRYEEALAAAAGASGYDEVVVANWGLVELVEAATRTGRVDDAEEALDRLAGRARAAGTPWVRGVEARSRALLAAGDAAEDGYRQALALLGTTRAGADLARARLLYGEWLRRANRRMDAREQLSAALDAFTAMGMAAFAERARREVLATGATVRKRAVPAGHDLTAQELQIARLARDGLSNPEIAAQLFISARTVEWHLRKVFVKVGVHSRRQLRQVDLAHQ
jgi:DNA-binding CsgD family transcriptional regulator